MTLFGNKWYQSSPLPPQQQEKLWDLQHPQDYDDPETITGKAYRKPSVLDTKQVPNRERRGKILKIVGIILAIAAGCGLLYGIYLFIRMFFR